MKMKATKMMANQYEFCSYQESKRRNSIASLKVTHAGQELATTPRVQNLKGLENNSLAVGSSAWHLIPDSRHIIVELSFLGKTAPAYTRLPRVQASQHQVGMPNLPLLEYAIVERKREAKTTRPHTQDPPLKSLSKCSRECTPPSAPRKKESIFTRMFYLFAASVVFFFVYG